MPRPATPRPEPVRSAAVDALLYSAAAAFALVMLGSAYARTRTWGAFAVPAYGAGAVASVLVLVLGARLGRRRVSAARALVAALVAAGAVLVPLGAEVQWRVERGSRYA